MWRISRRIPKIESIESIQRLPLPLNQLAGLDLVQRTKQKLWVSTKTQPAVKLAQLSLNSNRPFFMSGFAVTIVKSQIRTHLGRGSETSKESNLSLSSCYPQYQIEFHRVSSSLITCSHCAAHCSTRRFESLQALINNYSVGGPSAWPVNNHLQGVCNLWSLTSLPLPFVIFLCGMLLVCVFHQANCGVLKQTTWIQHLSLYVVYMYIYIYIYIYIYKSLRSPHHPLQIWPGNCLIRKEWKQPYDIFILARLTFLTYYAQVAPLKSSKSFTWRLLRFQRVVIISIDWCYYLLPGHLKVHLAFMVFVSGHCAAMWCYSLLLRPLRNWPFCPPLPVELQSDALSTWIAEIVIG